MSRPWKACSPGELGRLSSRLRSRRTRRTVARSGIAVAVVAFLALGVWTFRPRGGAMMEYDFAGIRCSRVIALAQDYAMHKLDPRLTNQIKSHVEQCPKCHPQFKAMGLISVLWPRDPLRPDSSYPSWPRGVMISASSPLVIVVTVASEHDSLQHRHIGTSCEAPSFRLRLRLS